MSVKGKRPELVVDEYAELCGAKPAVSWEGRITIPSLDVTTDEFLDPDRWFVFTATREEMDRQLRVAMWRALRAFRREPWWARLAGRAIAVALLVGAIRGGLRR